MVISITGIFYNVDLLPKFAQIQKDTGMELYVLLARNLVYFNIKLLFVNVPKEILIIIKYKNVFMVMEPL